MLISKAILPALLLAGLSASPTRAADMFAGANAEVGYRLLADNGCNGSCHQSYTEDNNPLTLYTRSASKVTTASGLLAQVERCIIRLNASIFPDDVKDIAASLNRDYYHFSE